MKIANIHEAKTNLSKLIESVLAGEEVIISKAGKPIVKLIPYSKPTKERTPGLWKGQVEMTNDFDSLPKEILNSFYGEEKENEISS